jgi:hypothetical protein
MHTLRIAAVAVVAFFCVSCSSSGGGTPLSTGFEETAGPVARPPAGWTMGENKGTGKPAAWVVVRDESAPRDPHVLLVRTENIEKTFNWCLAPGTYGADVEASVLVKPLSGHDDQGGGLMWRVQDAENYYVARWNPLENNVRLYFVKDGLRTKFGDAEVIATPGWKRMSVRAVGDRFEVWFDGKRVIDERDDAFSKGGRVGLWTKADACTQFDDFEAKSL